MAIFCVTRSHGTQVGGSETKTHHLATLSLGLQGLHQQPNLAQIELLGLRRCSTWHVSLPKREFDAP